VSLFPYPKFRPGQEEIYNCVKNFLGDDGSKILLIEAPTGIGKTSAILAPLLEHKFKILWFVKTHAEEDVILREINVINGTFNARFKAIGIKGIATLCNHEDVKRVTFPHQKCLWYRVFQLSKCANCPYLKQWELVPHAHVVVLPYVYLAKSVRRKILNYMAMFDAVVFDEAQHIMLPPEIRIPKLWLERASNEVGRKLDINDVLEVDEDLIRRVWSLNGQSFALEVKELMRDVDLKEIYEERDEEFNYEYYGFIDKTFYDYIKELIASRRAVFLSATLPPTDFVKRVLRVNSIRRVSIKVRMRSKYYIDVGVLVPKKLRRRMAYRVARRLKLLSFVKSIVFMPATRYAEYIVSRFDLPLTTNYEEFLRDPSKTLLLIAGSKMAEGIDLPEGKVSMIIGVPYAKPNKYLFRLYKLFRECGIKKVRLYAYDLPAIWRSIQAVGRVTRSPQDEKIVIFADKRYLKLRRYFPDWLKAQEFKVLNRFRDLKYLIGEILLKEVVR